MQIRIKNAAGAVMLLSGLPVIAQDSTAAKVLTTTGCASCPTSTLVVDTPGGPTWLVAGFVIGLVVGIVAAKAFGNKKQQQ